jgi:hypothetical protein
VVQGHLGNQEKDVNVGNQGKDFHAFIYNIRTKFQGMYSKC